MDYEVKRDSRQHVNYGAVNNFTRIPEDQVWHVVAWSVHASGDHYIGIEMPGGNTLFIGRTFPYYNGTAVAYSPNCGLCDVWLMPGDRFYSSTSQYYIQFERYSCSPSKK